MDSKKPASIDEYIAGFPEPVQAVLQQLRETVKAAAPDATEKISYQMPTFFLNGNLVYFAAFKNHIGFYPTPGTIKGLKDEIARYQAGKGTLQFPLDEPMPLDLVTKIVKVRVAENLKKAEEKSRKKK